MVFKIKVLKGGNMRQTPILMSKLTVEIIILSEVNQRKTNIRYRLYVESKRKKDTNELIYKTEIDPQA